MKNCFAIVGLLLLAGYALAADDVALKQIVRARVEEINNAIIKNDFGKVVDLTHPKIVELMGGRQKMVSTMEAGSKEMKAEGIELLSIKTDTPSEAIKSGSELFLTVTFDLEIGTPDGKFIQKSFVIGISGDDGKNWVFVNGDVDVKMIKRILPGLPESLKLPERQKPKKKS